MATSQQRLTLAHQAQACRGRIPFCATALTVCIEPRVSAIVMPSFVTPNFVTPNFVTPNFVTPDRP